MEGDGKGTTRFTTQKATARVARMAIDQLDVHSELIIRGTNCGVSALLYHLQRLDEQLRDRSALLSCIAMGSRSPMASGLATSQAAIDSYSQCRAKAVVSLTSVWNDLELDADDRAAALADTDRRAEHVWEAAVVQVCDLCCRDPPPPPGLHTTLIVLVTMQAEAGRMELDERTREAHRAVARIREQLGEAAEPPSTQQAKSSEPFRLSGRGRCNV